MHIKRQRLHSPERGMPAIELPSVESISCASLASRLAIIEPGSALGANVRAAAFGSTTQTGSEKQAIFREEPEAFVQGLSPAAKAFVSRPWPTTQSGTRPTLPTAAGIYVPPVPTSIAEEILAFADYAHVESLLQPAVDAIVCTLTVPRALRLLYACATNHREHGAGIAALKTACEDYLARRLKSVLKSKAYNAMSTRKRDTLRRALKSYVSATLRDPQSFGQDGDALSPIAGAIAHFVRRGRIHGTSFEPPHAMAWLSTCATSEVWQALAEAGQDLGALVTRDRAAAFGDAVNAGRVDLVTCMWAAVPPSTRDLLWTPHEHGPLVKAISRGDDAMVHALLSRLSPLQRLEVAANEEVWCAASVCEIGEQTVALRNHLPDVIEAQAPAVEGLVYLGIKSELQSFLQAHPQAGDLVARDGYNVFRLACSRANADMARLFLDIAEREGNPESMREMLTLGMQALATARPTGAGVWDEVQCEAARGVLETRAAAHGVDIYAHLTEGELLTACRFGHAGLVRTALQRATQERRRQLLSIGFADVGFVYTLFGAACEAAQTAVIEALFGFVPSIQDQAEQVFTHQGTAFYLATRSGDVALLRRLWSLAQHLPSKRDAWLANDEHVQLVLCQAVKSGAPEMLGFWLGVIPHERQAAILARAGLATVCLRANAHRMLHVLFALQPSIRDILVAEALAPVANNLFQVGISPLGEALISGSFGVVDVLLKYLQPQQEKRALQQNLIALCTIASEKRFSNYWNRFTPQEQAELATARFLTDLPRVASQQVAALLVRQYLDRFFEGLQETAVVQHMTLSQAWASRDILAVVPAERQADVLRVWGRALVRAAVQPSDMSVWDFMQKTVPPRVLMTMLVDDHVRLLEHPDGAVQRDMAAVMLLANGWHIGPMEAWCDRALAHVTSGDHVSVLRELVASHPDSEQRIPRERAGARVAAFLAALERQATI